ncbi:hypothetical protein Golob_026384, partial [Gossypium lobatum]|nr:hypothetical protein [Gossypium lobatum]
MDRSPRFGSISSDNCPMKTRFHYDWGSISLPDGGSFHPSPTVLLRHRSPRSIYPSHYSTAIILAKKNAHVVAIPPR